MRVCDSVILASAKWLGQDSGVAHGMLKLWLAWSRQDEDAQLLALWQSSQTDTQGGIWGHTIILYYFGSRVELVHIMSRATILLSFITFHLWVYVTSRSFSTGWGCCIVILLPFCFFCWYMIMPRHEMNRWYSWSAKVTCVLRLSLGSSRTKSRCVPWH